MKIFLLLLTFFLFSTFAPFAQKGIVNSEQTEISGGAEYNDFLQKQLKEGNASKFQSDGQIQKNELNKTTAITTYDGITFDEDAVNNGGFAHIPPDPIGVAGPSHLVSVVNTSIEVHSKAGVQLSSKRLGHNGTTAVGSFFESLSPTTDTFDPKVLYDQYAGRFVVVTLEKVGTIDDAVGNISRILLAVSATSDPTGTWYFHAIDSKLTISAHDSWADYPGFAVDEEAIYVTNNMFRFSGGSSLDSRLWIINKGLVGGFYSGAAASVAVYAFAGLAGIPGGVTGTTQPSHMFGTTGTLGTFLVSSGWLSGVTDFLSIIKVTNPSAAPTFINTFVSLGDIHSGVAFSDAPQSGIGTLIETNDMRALNAVWRNDILWVTNCVVPPSGTDAGQVTAHWYKIRASGAITPALSDQGNIGGESIATGCYTFFPSIAVNSSNTVAIGFSASASSIFPGCYFTGRAIGAAAGSTVTPDVVRAGVDYYVRTFGIGRNRWGDYSGSSVDPSDDQTFYLFNEYAMTRGNEFPVGEDGRWATAFGVVPAGALLVGIINESNDQANSFQLYQNYPNPFNPSTKISWQSPMSSWQTLKVYDVLGNEVATLVDEYKPAGSYETEFNTSGVQNLASGIYFYQLKAGSSVETKKMILMR